MVFSYLRRLDWILVGSLLGIIAIGLVTISSSSHQLFIKQITWVSLGLLFFIGASLIDWQVIVTRRIFLFALYGGIILLLLLTYFFAPNIRGSRGWLEIFGFRLQGSEFARIILILLYAAFFARRHISIGRPLTILFSFVYLIPIIGIIILQQDLGSAIVLFGLWIAFLLVSGIPLRSLGIIFLLILILSSLAWGYGLKSYQKERIVGFLYPETRTLGINFSVTQSKIAIGSAGFWGKGYGQGSETHLGFLPDALTDFILAAYIEEWGFFGAFVLLALFSLLFSRILLMGLSAGDNVSRFIALGTAAALLLNAGVNAGSTLGLMPVIGTPFPLLSYGGSSLLTFLILLGIVSSIAREARSRIL